jgi:K319L-like, PKD domain
MKTRLALCTAIVLCAAGGLYAQGATTWMGPDGGKWSDPSNWTGNVLPSADVKAFFNGPSTCIVDIPDAAAWQIDLGGGPLRIIQGGTVTVHDWFILGYNTDDTGDNAGRLEVLDGGVLDCLARLYVGYRGEGYLSVYEGGTVNIHSQLLGVGQQPGGNGVVELEGGSVNLLEGTNAQGLNFLSTAKSSVDLSGGALTLRGTTENLNYVNQAITDGIIKAYSGIGEVVVDPNEQPGRLVVRGIHPLKPFPTDDGRASAGQVQLSWTPRDPCVPGQPVPVDVYFTDDLTQLEQFTNPAAIRVVTKQAVTSVTVQTQANTRYYWAVDCYVGSPADPVFGPIFSFVAANLPPKVDAGKDIVTWLENGSRTGTLDATVTDDGPYTVQWTVVSEPNQGNAVIQTPDTEDTNVTLSATGQYVLQLDASDGESTSSDTVTINVYNDSCEAAQSVPGYVPLVGDLNGDCRVDDTDFQLLQDNWLKDNSLTDPWTPLN